MEIQRSPKMSKSGYFPPLVFYIDDFGLSQNLQCSKSDRNEIVSVPNSVSDSLVADLDFSLDPADFVPNFKLEWRGEFHMRQRREVENSYSIV
ncbi:WRKY Transcription Factor [Sarracenia purpurea var. burkii]